MADTLCTGSDRPSAPRSGAPGRSLLARLAALTALLAVGFGAAAVTAQAAPASTPAARTCSNTYTVRPGDGWTIIAARVGVKPRELYAANGASAQTPLYPGRSVCLPAGAAPAPTATTAPPTTPAPTTTVPQKTYTKAEVESIIRAVWPDDLEDKALAIAWRESNHKPGVRNWCCFGLFQMHWNAHKKWLATIGVTEASQLFDPLVNANAALTLYYRAGGWGPWGG